MQDVKDREYFDDGDEEKAGDQSAMSVSSACFSEEIL